MELAVPSQRCDLRVQEVKGKCLESVDAACSLETEASAAVRHHGRFAHTPIVCGVADLVAQCLCARLFVQARTAPGARGRTAPKLDMYVAQNLVQQLRAQFVHVAGDLQGVNARLRGYLADYRAEFKEEFTYQVCAHV